MSKTISHDVRRKKSVRMPYAKGCNAELAFSSGDVERFWSSVALCEYENANEKLDGFHSQRFTISVPRISMPSNGKLLNIWSRQGEALPYLRERFPHIEITNSEISKVMIKQCTERFPGEKVIECDLRTLCFEDKYFDAVLSLEMLEHSPSPKGIISEMFRVLKPGGQLILTCPSALSEIHLWFADRFFGNHGEGPHRFPSTLSVKRMLAEVGFELIEHKGTLFLPAKNPLLSVCNKMLEKMLQWFPANEFGIRQLYEARKAG